MIARAAAPLALVLALSGAACRREQRRFAEPAFLGEAPPPALADQGPYAGNAWAMSEGQRLFGQMNCVGCHGHGGGAIGPPLMDGRWIYGGDPGAIFDSIAQGRPKGMPRYREKLSDGQIWQLVAYVRALGGYAPSQAAPVRGDHMALRPPPSRTEPQPITHEDNP